MERETFAVAAEDSARVLIVEDNDEVRLMLSTFLRSKGYAVTCTGSATGGAAAAVVTRPDFIIMDLGLPDADGLSAVRSIRSNAGLVGVPVLVVSAYDAVQLRAEAVEAGCVGYMVKPVDLERLLETVRLLAPVGREGRGALEGVGDEGSVG